WRMPGPAPVSPGARASVWRPPIAGRTISTVSRRSSRWPRGRGAPLSTTRWRGSAVRDLAVLAVVCGSLPVILLRPFYGLLVYSWLAFMRPQDMAWGASRGLPLSLWVATALGIGLVL